MIDGYFGFVGHVLFALCHPLGTRDVIVPLTDHSAGFVEAWQRSFKDDALRVEFDEFKSLGVDDQRSRAGIKKRSKD